MKPTAEHEGRAAAIGLLIVRGIETHLIAARIAQALADEHERAMQQPAIREAEIRGATWALEYAEQSPVSVGDKAWDIPWMVARIVDAKRGEGR